MKARWPSRVLAVAASLAPLPAQSDAAAFAAAVADYRAGRHAAAFAVFQQQFESAGERASAELRWNFALAALRMQRSGDAEAAVAPWLAAEDAAARGAAEFVTAMAGCQRAERAATAAALPDAEPMAWTMAVNTMARAVAGFRRAAATREAWPEAVRNAERAEARLAELRTQRDAAAAAKAKSEAAPPPPGAPQPAPPEEQPVVLPEERLSAAELAAVRAKVAAREREKKQVRRDQRASGGVVGERGW